jgi:hypothetical protein
MSLSDWHAMKRSDTPTRVAPSARSLPPATTVDAVGPDSRGEVVEPDAMKTVCAKLIAQLNDGFAPRALLEDPFGMLEETRRKRGRAGKCWKIKIYCYSTAYIYIF